MRWESRQRAKVGLALLALLALLGVFALIDCSTRSARAHDWYTGQKNARGSPCCYGGPMGDCGKVSACILPNGTEGIHIQGMCREIPAHALMPEASPDGDIQACMLPSDREPRCVWYGGST